MTPKNKDISTELDAAGPICPTGVTGLDEILCGGLPSHRLYLVQGEPGTGKTTLALQFLREGVTRGERCLYITFSETKDELNAVARSHGWTLNGVDLFDLSSVADQLTPEAQNTVFHPSEVEMNETVQLILAEVDRVKPHRVVFDSVTELRMLAETALKYRRQILSLKQVFSSKQCTVLFLDDLTAAPRDLQVQSIVHGVIQLQRMHPEFGGERRRISVVKLRGVQFMGGNHDYVIRKGGLKVFPRIVSSDHASDFQQSEISSGISELDALLGGGLDRGTSNLFLGPAGTGKSTLAIQYVFAAVERGERAAVYAFEESLQTMMSRTRALGIDLQKHIDSGLLHIQKIDPAELSPGEFADDIRNRVLNDGVKVVAIDSLNGYLHAMPQEQYLILQLHELLSFLGKKGVLTILVLAQQGIMGSMMQTPVDLTYLADTVVITRYFEARGAVRKAVSVIKKRGGMHESTIRELKIGLSGVNVGKPLENFQGVLTGVPLMVGSASAPG
jgi:circadian clock protein KaiC